ncbi:hypothetical protein ACOME3_009221 [Neoechinorhynchus agilis]
MNSSRPLTLCSIAPFYGQIFLEAMTLMISPHDSLMTSPQSISPLLFTLQPRQQEAITSKVRQSQRCDFLRSATTTSIVAAFSTAAAVWLIHNSSRRSTELVDASDPDEPNSMESDMDTCTIVLDQHSQRVLYSMSFLSFRIPDDSFVIDHCIHCVPNRVHQDYDFSNEPCSICLECMYPARSISMLKCCHVFHFKCIRDWLCISLTCPVCRYQCSPFSSIVSV